MADTTKRIIYLQDNGILAVIIPSPNETRTIDEIAKKDVDTGKPYKIVDETDIPTDWTFRDAWNIDEAELTDGVGD